MEKKLNSNLYYKEYLKWIPKEHTHRYVHLPDDCLYAEHNGRKYPTTITVKDLPEYYIYGRYYKQWGYMNCKGVKDVIYMSIHMLENHVLKDDWLLISYTIHMRRDLSKVI